MTKEIFDFVIPLYKIRWSTRAVLEAISLYYEPRSIQIITSTTEAELLRKKSLQWQTAPINVHEEETFFVKPAGLTKEEICQELNLGESLYNPGWFYQQLLKLGASEGIENLSEWYIVWDSDLLPVATWPLISYEEEIVKYKFALLQHNQWGNFSIVSKWDKWIRTVLGVEPITDVTGTFVPHHMWFKQEYLSSFKQQVQNHYQSPENWLLLMMRSANEFGTFSEYWAYASWVAAKAPNDFAFYPYLDYGETSERFFDDGTGVFCTTFKKNEGEKLSNLTSEDFAPSYTQLKSFIEKEYGLDALPSSLSFESSPRHLKKGKENKHIEELRSRWNTIDKAINTARS